MCTPVLLIALVGFINRTEPNWLDDYSAARQQGQAAKKPLAVFVGSGKAGWDKLAHDGKLSKETRQLLATKYVCLYVDTQTKSGRRLATALEIDNSLGIVISDGRGQYMAFHHEGDLASPDLQ